MCGVSAGKTQSVEPPLHLTDLSPETGHLVLQLPHPVSLGERGGEVVLRGDLLVLQHSLIKSLSARLGLCNEQVRDIKRYYWRENNKTDQDFRKYFSEINTISFPRYNVQISLQDINL